MRTTLRILAKVVDGTAVDERRLREGFAPGVFATDAALRMVASGTPWREAYHDVRDHLERLSAEDPDAAVAAQTHAGTTGGLDYSVYDARLASLRESVDKRASSFKSKREALLSRD